MTGIVNYTIRSQNLFLLLFQILIHFLNKTTWTCRFSSQHSRWSGNDSWHQLRCKQERMPHLSGIELSPVVTAYSVDIVRTIANYMHWASWLLSMSLPQNRFWWLLKISFLKHAACICRIRLKHHVFPVAFECPKFIFIFHMFNDFRNARRCVLQVDRVSSMLIHWWLFSYFFMQVFGIASDPRPGLEGHISPFPVDAEGYMPMLVYKNGSST